MWRKSNRDFSKGSGVMIRPLGYPALPLPIPSWWKLGERGWTQLFFLILLIDMRIDGTVKSLKIQSSPDVQTVIHAHGPSRRKSELSKDVEFNVWRGALFSLFKNFTLNPIDDEGGNRNMLYGPGVDPLAGSSSMIKMWRFILFNGAIQLARVISDWIESLFIRFYRLIINTLSGRRP